MKSLICETIQMNLQNSKRLTDLKNEFMVASAFSQKVSSWVNSRKTFGQTGVMGSRSLRS